MTYLAYEAREVTSAVLARPELAQAWKQAAQHNLIKAVGLGRYSAVLDENLAKTLRNTFPDLAVYNYDDGTGTVRYGEPA